MTISVDFDRTASSCVYAGPPGFDEYRVDVRLAVTVSGHDQPPASLWFELDVPTHPPDHPTAYSVHVTVTPTNGVWKIQCDGWWADAFNAGTAKVFSAMGGVKLCEDTITPIRDEFGPRLVWGSSLTKPVVEPKKPKKPKSPPKLKKPKLRPKK